jgi:hypothetical protein
MQLQPYVGQVQAHLTAAAALGDDRTRQTADALAAAAEPAMRLAVLAAVSAAADEITSALLDTADAPTVAVRLDGDDLRIEVRTTEAAAPEAPPAAGVDDSDASARISLRLAESLKAEIENAARVEAVSVNTWLVRAAARALQPTRPHRGGWEARGFDARGNNPHHITGWINS